MAGRSTVTFAEVRLWGASVGLAAWDPELGYAAFEYDAAFLDTGIELSPVMMPLSPGSFVFPALNRDTFRGLPGMLADSLPDKFGNSLIISTHVDVISAGEELPAVPPFFRGGVLEPQPRLVDQRGRLEGVVGPLAAQPLDGNRLEFLVDQR